MYIGKSELMEDVEADRSVVKIVRERGVKRYVYSLGVLNTLSVRVSQLVSIDVSEAMEQMNQQKEEASSEVPKSVRNNKRGRYKSVVRRYIHAEGVVYGV